MTNPLDIQAAARGDDAAFARVVAAWQPEVTAWMWRFTRDPNELDELVQETFVQLYLSLSRYRPTGSFGGWVRRIATRVGYRFWRRQTRKPILLAEHLDETVADRTASPATPTAEAVLAELPARDRLVLTLRFLEGRSVEETADLLEATPEAIRQRCTRARRRLRAQLIRRGLMRDEESGDPAEMSS